ncbi:MAG: Glutamine--scyllo-inositol transaminase [Thermoleophilia bacterium]|jgi:dTDP-4-amino-4,6-dideoxygalactose transaminase|nr:Glutamine--scyllo-inositol transaminase [Thermoleophilia bacterium]
MAVPLMDPRAQYEPYIAELEQIAAEVIRSGQFILGPHVKAFEAEAAEYLGVKHAIGVGNGTDAITIALRALGVKPGDEVICPAYTFFATPETISSVGAVPVFADVDADTCCLDIDDVRARITGKTRAILPVHLFGQVADMQPLLGLAKEHGLAVIEDSAQAWGAEQDGTKAGAFGDAATFSFFPTKNLPAFGDGGLIATNSDEVNELARMLRFHGSKDKKVFEHVGYNSRLDDLQAAIIRRNLKEVDGWNAHRRQVAAWYEEAGLADLVELPPVGEGNVPIWHLYVVRTDHRAALLEACKERGVGATVYYGDPHHTQPVYASLGYAPGDLPVTERLCATGVALPMFATMTRDQVTEVVEAVRAGVPAGVR